MDDTKLPDRGFGPGQRRGGYPTLRTDVIRELAKQGIADGTGALSLIRDTIPALCTEVDYLRNIVEIMLAERDDFFES